MATADCVDGAVDKSNGIVNEGVVGKSSGVVNVGVSVASNGVVKENWFSDEREATTRVDVLGVGIGTSTEVVLRINKVAVVVLGSSGIVIAGGVDRMVVLDGVATGVSSNGDVDGRADVTTAVVELWQLMAFE